MGCTCNSDETHKSNKYEQNKEYKEISKAKIEKKVIKTNHLNNQGRREGNNTINDRNENEIFIASKNQEGFNFPEEIKEIYVGEGLKRMRGYISNINLEELKRIRNEFWETRVEGDKEIWLTLRACCEEIEAKEIPLFLEAAGIKIYKNCINITFDSKGKSYEIPNYCVNLPIEFKNTLNKFESIKKISSNKIISVMVKYFGNSFLLAVKLNETVMNIKERLKNNYNQKFQNNIETNDIRLFYGGKELLNELELIIYNIEADSIILMNLKVK